MQDEAQRASAKWICGADIQAMFALKIDSLNLTFHYITILRHFY